MRRRVAVLGRPGSSALIPSVKPLPFAAVNGYELGSHKAEDWTYPQRLVLVVVDKPDPKTGQLELFPRYFFLLTTWTKEEKDGDELLAHYRRRGTFEDRFSE